MGSLLDEVPLHLEGGIQPVEHVVERVGQLPELVGRPTEADPARQVGALDPPGDGGDTSDRMHDETGDVPPDRQAGEEEDRQSDDGVDPQLSQRSTVYGLLEDLQATARIVQSRRRRPKNRGVDEFGERRVPGHRLVVEDT